jgi:hypothetical protein
VHWYFPLAAALAAIPIVVIPIVVVELIERHVLLGGLRVCFLDRSQMQHA